MDITPFSPTTHVITTTRSRENEETSTTVLRETHYQLARGDNFTLGLNTVVLERGGYGDSYRETVRLERYETDFVSDAVIALLQHCVNELRSQSFGEEYRRRCEDLVRRAVEIFPSPEPKALAPVGDPHLTVVITEPKEA